MALSYSDEVSMELGLNIVLERLKLRWSKKNVHKSLGRRTSRAQPSERSKRNLNILMVIESGNTDDRKMAGYN